MICPSRWGCLRRWMYVVLGELALDAGIRSVAGVLPAAIHAAGNDNSLICPDACGGEAAWAGDDLIIVAPQNLLQLINHIKGTQVLRRPTGKVIEDVVKKRPDLGDVKGQETAKRALEIAAAGGHNMLMIGPPGSGKSMLASCLPSILPPLTPREALEVSMIHSLSGTLSEGGLMKTRPFRDPHHSASLPALIGGGHKVKPGEISLAHQGVLFLDELPEFSRATLESLRQPLETGETLVARANNHVTYPARFQLIAAMNPCRCGYLGNPDSECTKAPRCGADYQTKLSGPLLDRIDIQVDVPAVSVADLNKEKGESSASVASRIAQARDIQAARYRDMDNTIDRPISVNAHASGDELETQMMLSDPAKALLNKAAERMKFSARTYYRLIRVCRTIADLGGQDAISKDHVAEALSYRKISLN